MLRSRASRAFAVAIRRLAQQRALSSALSPKPSSIAVRFALPSKRSASTTPAPDKKPLFTKILIANRGEIACRVIRTAKQLGVRTVAVYSDADVDGTWVKLADEAYHIGPAPSSESYLNGKRILEIAQKTGAQAIHPCYGFLSENHSFVQMCEKAGVTFIGPPKDAMRAMGSKSESKDIMLKAGVPCVPGWHPSSATNVPNAQSLEHLQERADEIGYPLLIKAVSGGGGKGMKIAHTRAEFASQLESAKRESMKSFGDDEVLLERYLTRPRHVEVQIFSDNFGNHVSLFERDCSVQRRHQKIIEEAPAPGLDPDLRERLYETARKAAAAVGYRGAGTVEFIMDADNPENYYFMEMNTRLQVEHPITEEITGVDLVQWQLEIASGNPIPLKQEEITCNGHAFECRIYAENPENNFLPDTGTLKHIRLPRTAPNVRMETGFVQGDEISVYYDPLIAKLIVHGSDRDEALRILRIALAEYQVVGPNTNIDFLKRLADHPAFVKAEVETGFIPKFHDELFAPRSPASPAVLAQTALFLSSRSILSSFSPVSSNPWSNVALAGFRAGGVPSLRTYKLVEPKSSNEASVTLSSPDGQGGFGRVVVRDFEGHETTFENVAPLLTGDGSSIEAMIAGSKSRVDVVSEPLSGGAGGERLHVFDMIHGWNGTFEVRPPVWLAELKGKVEEKVGSAKAPMPSRIVQVSIKTGDKVEAGAPLVTVEAMKTEHVLRAPKAGVVSLVHASVGELVPEGKVLVEFEVEEEEGEKAA